MRPTGLPQQVEILRFIAERTGRPPPVLDSEDILKNPGGMLASRPIPRDGGGDAVMLDTRGFVAETNATHLFFIERGRVRTSRTVACPEGVTRAVVLEPCAEHGIPHELVDLSLTEAYRADEVFCTGNDGRARGRHLSRNLPLSSAGRIGHAPGGGANSFFRIRATPS